MVFFAFLVKYMLCWLFKHVAYDLTIPLGLSARVHNDYGILLMSSFLNITITIRRFNLLLHLTYCAGEVFSLRVLLLSILDLMYTHASVHVENHDKHT